MLIISHDKLCTTLNDNLLNILWRWGDEKRIASLHIQNIIENKFHVFIDIDIVTRRTYMSS